MKEQLLEIGFIKKIDLFEMDITTEPSIPLILCVSSAGNVYLRQSDEFIILREGCDSIQKLNKIYSSITDKNFYDRDNKRR